MFNSSTFSRHFRVLLILLLSTLLVVTLSVQAKPGKGGGKPGDDPEPVCTDQFPSFVYVQEATRKSPAGIFLASADGCRREFVAEAGIGRPHMHMRADRPEGVLMWTAEDPDNTNHYTVQRANFTVNTDERGERNLVVSGPTTVDLKLPDEELVPPEDFLYYFSMDIWGNADHSELYLVIHRLHVDNNDETNTNELWLFNLEVPTDRRQIFQSLTNPDPTGDPIIAWTCPNVPYPEAVATCYGAGTVQWNPSGTRLYLADTLTIPDGEYGERWNGGVRVDITRQGEDLSEWYIFPPKLVYTSSRSGEATTSELTGTAARPSVPPDSTEYIATNYLDHSGNNTVQAHAILNADLCVASYLPYSSGEVELGPELWRLLSSMCLTSFSTSNQTGRGDTWQSPDLLLYSGFEKRTYSIFRLDVNTGVSTKLIDNGRFADTGQ